MPKRSGPSSRCSAWRASVTEREQSGRTVFRVRLGPFEKKEDAVVGEGTLDGAGVDSALDPVQQ